MRTMLAAMLALLAIGLMVSMAPGEEGQPAEEPIGLSKGPDDPAEIGTRCGILAGRDDRAYLDCAAQIRPEVPKQLEHLEPPRSGPPDHPVDR